MHDTLEQLIEFFGVVYVLCNDSIYPGTNSMMHALCHMKLCLLAGLFLALLRYGM